MNKIFKICSNWANLGVKAFYDPAFCPAGVCSNQFLHQLMLKLDKYILQLEQIYFAIWTNCKNSSSFLWPCAFCPAVCSNQFTHQLQSVRIEGWLTNTKNTQNPNYKNLKHTKVQEYTKFKSTKVQTCISDKFSHKLQSIGLKEDEVRWYNEAFRIMK